MTLPSFYHFPYTHSLFNIYRKWLFNIYRKMAWKSENFHNKAKIVLQKVINAKKLKNMQVQVGTLCLL